MYTACPFNYNKYLPTKPKGDFEYLFAKKKGLEKSISSLRVNYNKLLIVMTQIRNEFPLERSWPFLLTLTIIKTM